MPAKLTLTPKQYMERQRELSRLRVRRMRAKRKAVPAKASKESNKVT